MSDDAPKPETPDTPVSPESHDSPVPEGTPVSSDTPVADATPAPTTAVAPPPIGAAYAGLIWLTVLGILGGGILIIVGATNYGSFDGSEFSEHTDSGIVELFLGAAAFNVGVVAGLVLMGVSAVVDRVRR